MLGPILLAVTAITLWSTAIPPAPGPAACITWYTLLSTATLLWLWTRRPRKGPAFPTTDLRAVANASGQYPPTPSAPGTPRHQP